MTWLIALLSYLLVSIIVALFIGAFINAADPDLPNDSERKEPSETR